MIMVTTRTPCDCALMYTVPCKEGKEKDTLVKCPGCGREYTVSEGKRNFESTEFSSKSLAKALEAEKIDFLKGDGI